MYVAAYRAYPLHKCLPPKIFIVVWLLPEQIIPLPGRESKAVKNGRQIA
jgi:hypothetical protein